MRQDAHLCARVPTCARRRLSVPTEVESRSATCQNGCMVTASGLNRVLLHVSRTRRVTVEPDDIYYLEATGGETIVRKRGRRTIQDVRP